jgi:hypothetical protein
MSWTASKSWLLLKSNESETSWLGDGKTSENIIKILKKVL